MALHPSKYLDRNERDRLLKHLDHAAIVARSEGRRILVRDHALWTFALASGLSASELAAVRIADVRLAPDHPVVIVRNGERSTQREVSLPVAIRGTLVDYVAWLGAVGLPSGPDDALFPSRNGGPMTRGGMWKRWKSVLLAAGIEHKPLHATRHTAALMLYRATGDLRLVKRHLGHARRSTTAIYAELLPEDVQAGIDAAWEEVLG